MKRIATLFVCLSLPACVLDAELETDAETSAVSTHRFAINPSSTDIDTIGSGASVHILCNHLANGVVSGWELDEINAFDFRGSRKHCTEMSGNGWLTGYTDWIDHFRHTGNATRLSANVPVDMLPTGVRVKLAPGNGSKYKLSDAAFLYNDARSIYAGHTGSVQGNWATGRSRGTVYHLRCKPGFVIRGLIAKVPFHEDTQNRSRISGLEIRCKELVRRPISPIPEEEPVEHDPQG